MNKADPENLEDIVRRARLGDAEAFGVLYQAYFTPLYRYIYFRVLDRSEADDLTQDVFLKAYASFGRYEHTDSSPLAYFYTIARNCIIDHARKKKTVRADDEVFDNSADDTASAEVQAVHKEEHAALRQKIAQLPHDQQDTIVLRFIEGLSTREVASMLGKSEVAIRQLQSRGLRLLKDIFTKESHTKHV